ncbi:MAG: SRPBCC domain-containing protein [Bacteroidetes bacterium]|nr:SRPBCC domain-containing protein [Bacteroidota bacterium]
MKKNPAFDFIVDKATKTIRVKREFNSELSLVWDAFTKPEILDQWWAPKPFASKTKYMNFEVGGKRFYAMISPEGQEHWSIQEYTAIYPKTHFKMNSFFSDKEGNPNLPGSNWDLNFSEENGTTKVSITIYNESLDRMESMIEMGFKEGFTMVLENLDKYVEEKFILRKQNKVSKKPRVSNYLNFDGKTEEAFLFYKSVFKTEFSGKGIQRFGDIQANAGSPPIAESIKNMILHVELPITENYVLMGTDAPKEMGFTIVKGNNMHICIEPETKEEADRLFQELSIKGSITMPMADMFFGAYFGEFTDQYGINWMIHFQNTL